jgi:hypothetical protein
MECRKRDLHPQAKVCVMCHSRAEEMADTMKGKKTHTYKRTTQTEKKTTHFKCPIR